MTPERAWWRRVPLVLHRPHEVFAALRDESDEQAHARQEPVLALVVLAGMAVLLSSARAGTLLDHPGRSEAIVAVWAFVGGLVYGAVAYFALGVLVLLGMTLAGSLVRYRSARHLLAYAAVPLALSLALWPVRLALFGGDSFRSGGSDSAAAGAVLDALQTGFALWAVALLALGIRAYTGFGWGRSLAAAAIPAALPLALLARGHGLV